MRLVDRKTFLTLPAGTFYCWGAQWWFGPLCIKGENALPPQWWYRSLDGIDADADMQLFDRYEAMLAADARWPLNESENREDRVEDGELFLIYEAADLLALRSAIDQAIALTKEPAA